MATEDSDVVCVVHGRTFMGEDRLCHHGTGGFNEEGCRFALRAVGPLRDPVDDLVAAARPFLGCSRFPTLGALNCVQRVQFYGTIITEPLCPGCRLGKAVDAVVNGG